MYSDLYCRIVGSKPLLLHNGQMADPANPIARENKRINDKKQRKSDRDREIVSELEWAGGLYLAVGRDKNGGITLPASDGSGELVTLSVERPTDDSYTLALAVEGQAGDQVVTPTSQHIVLPGFNLESMLWKGGKQQSKGPKFRAGVVVEGNFPLIHEWPVAPLGELVGNPACADSRTVVVSRNRIVRRRPRFRRWACDFTVSYLPSVLGAGVIESALRDGGTYVGCGDFSPRFGTYTYEISDKPLGPFPGFDAWAQRNLEVGA